MLRVPIQHAQAGMRLATPILHPQRGNTLLNVGFELTESLVRKLQELEVHECWIEYPGTEEIARYISPAIMQRRGQLVQHMAGLLEQAQRKNTTRLDFTPYQHTIRDLIEEIALDQTAGTLILELGGTRRCELRHAAEVCFLSIVLGIKLRDYLLIQRKRLSPNDARNLIGLGLGALVHDIGMMKVAPETRTRFLDDGDEDDPIWRSHVTLGYRMLSGTIRPAAAGVIAQHHQYFDGSGFPDEEREDGSRRALSGREIHVFARIVALANHYDRMRHGAEQGVVPRVRVMRDLLFGPLASRFDPVVLAALPRAIPAYAPGTMVRLNSGETAVVTGWNQDAPCRPMVSVIDAEHESWATEPSRPSRQIDLEVETAVHIVEEGGVNVADANFELPTEAELNAA